jgi:hypothetical protein
MALLESRARAEMEGVRLDTRRRLPNLVRICEKLLQHAGKSLSAALVSCQEVGEGLVRWPPTRPPGRAAAPAP